MKHIALALAATLIVSPGASSSTSAAARVDAEPTGTLSVSSEPAGAAVYVDGRLVGRTPLDIQRLAAGDHRVRLTREGHLENGRLVAVSRGKAEKLQVRLTALSASEAALATQTDDTTPKPAGGSSKKWLYAAVVAGAGVAAAAVILATRNHAPTVSGVTASPGTGLQSATTISVSAQASDQDNDSLTYAWDFGDGGTASSSTATHVYASAGAFTVRLTVSDGKASAIGQTSVTIRSLTGTWRSSSVGYQFNGVPQGSMQWQLALTQSGSGVAGAIQPVGAIPQLSTPGSISGIVRSTAPIVTLVGNVPGWLVPTFTLDPNADVNTLTGRWADAGSGQTITFNRQ